MLLWVRPLEGWQNGELHQEASLATRGAGRPGLATYCEGHDMLESVNESGVTTVER